MGRFCLAVVVLLFSAGSCPAQRLVVGEKAPELKVGEWLLHKDALSDSCPTLVEFFFSRSEPSLRRLTVLDGFIRDHSERLNVILMVRESRERLWKGKATPLLWRSTTGTGRSRPMACNLFLSPCCSTPGGGSYGSATRRSSATRNCRESSAGTESGLSRSASGRRSRRALLSRVVSFGGTYSISCCDIFRFWGFLCGQASSFAPAVSAAIPSVRRKTCSAPICETAIMRTIGNSSGARATAAARSIACG